MQMVSKNNELDIVSYSRETYEVFLHHISSQPSNKANEENNEVEHMAQESCLTNEAKAKFAILVDG